MIDARAERYAEAAILSELDALRNTTSGRNAALNKAAFALGSFVAAGALREEDAVKHLEQACETNGYARKDGWPAARASIKSGLRKGMQTPRELPRNTSADNQQTGSRPKPLHRQTLAEFAAERKIPLDALKHMGWEDTPRGILIRYVQRDGKPARSQYREPTFLEGRFAWEPKSDLPKIAYDPDQGALARKRGDLLICEGASDASTASYAGLPVIGIPGESYVRTTLLAHHLEGVARAFVCVDTNEVGDPDAGGVKFRVDVPRHLESLGFKGAVHEFRMPDNAKDMSELWVRDPEAFVGKMQEAMRAASEPPKAEPVGISPADIVERWKTEGPLTRVPTGIAPLDELCMGGLPVPWRVMIVGAPSAGKTYAEISIADNLARAAGSAGLYVGILAVDEEPDDITIRFAQLAGYTVSQAEERDPSVLSSMAEALRGLRIHLYDSTNTIEAAATDLAAKALAEGCKGALFVDSLQAVSSDAGALAKSPRELVEANVKAMRWAQDHHGLLVVATVEANRASYRDDDAADSTNDLAAGAESRAIEFGAKTQLMLRTPKGHPDVVWVRVAKNRRAKRGEFFLAMDRERHTLTPCEDPRGGPAAAQEADTAKQRANLAKVEADARTLLKLVLKRPGMGERGLRVAIKADGHTWGVERIDAAKLVLERGVDGYRLENRGNTRASVWSAVPSNNESREE